MTKCTMCGYPMKQHEVDPGTGRLTKCPVHREAKTTPPQERARSPRGDY